MSANKAARQPPDNATLALLLASDDLAAFEAALSEGSAGPMLNVVERARAYRVLIDKHGLTHGQVGERVGHSLSTVYAMVGMLKLSQEILGYLERGELSQNHAQALLRIKDVDARGRMARRAVEEGWSARELKDYALGKARPSDADAAVPDLDTAAVDRDAAALSVAKVWGDVLGLAVGVRTLPLRKGYRVEIVFTSSKAALASGERLGDAISLLEAQTRGEQALGWPPFL
jgi:ParB-like chromosome segregation protein Spo0J